MSNLGDWYAATICSIKRRVTEILVEWLRAWPDLSLGSGFGLAAVFVLASIAFLPRSFLLFATGAIFGTKAIAIAWSGLVIGAAIAFLASRYLLADRVQSWLAKSRHLRAIAAAVDAEGWKIVALLRLGSPFSNTMQNYVFGVTRIALTPYLVASAIFMAPQTALLIYLGATGRQALESGEGRLQYLLLVAMLLASIAAFVLVWARAREALHARGLDTD